jgi:hypothetical protein
MRALRPFHPIGDLSLINLKELAMRYFMAVGIIVLMFASVICGVSLLLLMTINEPKFTEEYLRMIGSSSHMAVLSSILLVLVAIYDELNPDE